MNDTLIVIHIHNRGDNLNQSLWVRYIDEINKLLAVSTPAKFFAGHSLPGCFQRHYCWIIQFPWNIHELQKSLGELAGRFNQDFITMITGEPVFVDENGSHDEPPE